MKKQVTLMGSLAVIFVGASMMASNADQLILAADNVEVEQISPINMIDTIVTGSTATSPSDATPMIGQTLLELCDAECQQQRLDKWKHLAE